MRRPWTTGDDALLRRLYADAPLAELQERLERTSHAIYGRVNKLGLHRSAAFISRTAGARLTISGAPFRFKKGQTPSNKGLRRPGWGPGRMKETQFKKGQRGSKWVPVGSRRLIDGYDYTKVRDIRCALWTRNWRPTHILLWERHRGRVPRGHVVAFVNGDRTDIRFANLECITRRELARRNHISNVPEPLRSTILALGAVRRAITRRARRDEEQDRAPARPSVRDDRGAEGREEPDGPRPRAHDRRRRSRDRRLGESRDGLHRRDRTADRDGVHSSAARARAAPRGLARRSASR
jgi:hypothetical protein